MENVLQSLKSIFASFFSIGILILPFAITYLKKKRQVGKLWSGVLCAKVRLQGKDLHCSHCASSHFFKREGILVTSWVAYFRFSFWNQSAACYECIRCGSVQWFSRPQQEEVEMIDLTKLPTK